MPKSPQFKKQPPRKNKKSSAGNYNENVFINCPFDNAYKKLFKALVFTVIDCGFTPRCTLESSNALWARLDKIKTLIRNSKLSIHDISRVQKSGGVPRFNMPFELGLFCGAEHFAGNRGGKDCLILDSVPHQYDKTLSDLSGFDIEIHNDLEKKIISIIRDWLNNHSAQILPGGGDIYKRYKQFDAELPSIWRAAGLYRIDLPYKNFPDYSAIVAEWLNK